MYIQGRLYSTMGPRARQCTGALMTTIYKLAWSMLVGPLCLLGPWASTHWAHVLRQPCVHLYVMKKLFSNQEKCIYPGPRSV